MRQLELRTGSSLLRVLIHGQLFRPEFVLALRPFQQKHPAHSAHLYYLNLSQPHKMQEQKKKLQKISSVTSLWNYMSLNPPKRAKRKHLVMRKTNNLTKFLMKKRTTREQVSRKIQKLGNLMISNSHNTQNFKLNQFFWKNSGKNF